MSTVFRLALALLTVLAAPTASATASSGEECDITIEGHHGGTSGRLVLDLNESQVRTRVGWWASLRSRNSNAPELAVLEPGTEFSIDVRLRLGCNAHRRYRFVLIHGDETRTYVYPSEDGYTQDRTIDLGALSRFFDIAPAPEPEPIAFGDVELEGSWVRSESNNDPNDGMRILVEGDEAVMTSVPESAGSAWREGEVLWRDIGADGSLLVRGSDGTFYPAELTAETERQLTLSIRHSGAGNDQTWVRYGGCWPPDHMAEHGERTPGMWVRSSTALPSSLREALRAARDADAAIQTAALTPDDAWVVVAANRPCYSSGFPEDARASIDGFVEEGRTIDAVAFGARGQWMVVAEGAVAHEGVPDSAVNWVERLHGQARRFDAVALARDGAALVAEGELYTFGTVPSDLAEAVGAARTGQRPIHDIAFGTDGQWVLVAGDWFVTSGAPRDLFQQLHRYRTDEDRRIDHVVLHRTDTELWALVSNHAAPAPLAAADSMQQAMGPDGDASIWERMDTHDVRGLSVAVVRGDEILWARGYGFRASNSGRGYERYVYPSTVFDAASISKPVTAAAALQLVDDGDMSLTGGGVLTDLVGTAVPVTFGPGITLLDPTGGVSLARLLSHCAGIDHRHGGSGAQPRDADKNEVAIDRVILGLPPAGTRYGAVRTFAPGDSTHYSGANYALVQGLIEAHADGGFNSHLRAFFDDLEMFDSSFRLPEDRAARYAYGYDPDDDDCESGSCPAYFYPNKAAAGLTTTAVDLARFTVMLNHRGRYAGRQVLREETAERMLKLDAAIGSTLVETTCDDPGTMGLGMRIRRRGQSDERFWHGGVHNGFRNVLYGYPRSDVGLVILATGDRDGIASLQNEIRGRFNAIYR